MHRLMETPFAEPLAERLRRPASQEVRLFWLGQAGFVLEACGLRLVIDPYLSNFLAAKYAQSPFSHERLMPAPIDPDGLGAVDYVLGTHHHTDHLDPSTLKPLAQRLPNLKFIVPASAMEIALERTGAASSRLLCVDAGQVIELTNDVSVHVLRAAHETLERDGQGRHRFLGYLIAANGVRIYHSGDCAPFDGHAREIGGSDLALLPVNGRSDRLRQAGFAGNFTVAEAVSLCRTAHIPNLIGHHYGLFAFNTVDPVVLDAALSTAPLQATRARMQTEYTLSSGR